MIFIACKPFFVWRINLHWRVRNFTPETAKSHRKIWEDRWDCWGQGKSWWDVNFNNGIYGPPCPTLLFHKTKPFLQMKFLEIENECKAKFWQKVANFKVNLLYSLMFASKVAHSDKYMVSIEIQVRCNSPTKSHTIYCADLSEKSTISESPNTIKKLEVCNSSRPE